MTGDAIRNEITLISSDCSCPGQSIQITCSVIGVGFTVWQGSTFNCPSSQNEISLRHISFASNNAVGECNGITARGLGVSEQNCYLSQLTLVLSTTSSQTVTCIYDDLTDLITIGEVVVNLTTGKLLIYDRIIFLIAISGNSVKIGLGPSYKEYVIYYRYSSSDEE